MTFDIQTPTPIFLNYESKSILFYDELNNYEGKIRKIQNEFAGALKQEQAVLLMDWINRNMEKSW